MKKFALLSVLLMFVIPVSAENMFQYNNPFPQQTGNTEMYNIYSAEPNAKKAEEPQPKRGWFSKKNKSDNTVKIQPVSPVNEGIQGDGSFYVFK